MSRCGVMVEKWLSSYRHIFVLGQFLHGVGASPLYTLGITYLDESVPVKMSSMYLGAHCFTFLRVLCLSEKGFEIERNGKDLSEYKKEWLAVEFN